MAGDRRDIKINVTVDSDTRGSKQAAKSLEEVDASAVKAEKSLTELRQESERVDAQIAKTKARVKELGDELVRAGDRATGRGSLRQQLGAERSWLRELERTAKDLAPTIQKGLFDGLNDVNLPFGISGQMAGIGAAVVAGAAPALSAGLAAAVLGGVGIGGVVGGAFLAARDDNVKTAWKELGDGIMRELEPAGLAFSRPMVEAAHSLGKAFEDSGIVAQLEKAAPLVQPLADALAGFGKNLAPGLGKAFEGAAPVIEQLAREMPKLGTSFSHFLGDLADIGPEAGVAMHDFFNVLDKGIDVTGEVVTALGKVYPAIRPLIDIVPLFGIAQIWEELQPHDATVTGIEKGATAVGGALHGVGNAAEDAGFQVRELNEQWDLLMGKMSSDQAADNIIRDFRDLSNQVAENGTTLDANTEAGNRNRTMVRGLIEDLKRQYDADIAGGMGSDEALAKYHAQANELQNNLSVQLGFAADGVAALIGQYKNVPAVVSTEFRTTYIATTGYGGGEHSGLGDVRDRQRASGGPVTAGVSYLVGEHRPEVFTPSTSGYISSSVDKWAAGMGGGGAQTIRIEVGGTPSGPLEQMFLSWLSKAIQVRGGDGAVIGIRSVG